MLRESDLGRLLVRSGLVLVLLLGQFSLTQKPAIAVLRQHHDAPGIVRYHAQASLRDELGYAWQVVLFKQLTLGQPTRYNLRLVGFPGMAELIHPQPLEIITASGQLLTASDVFAQEAPAPNVGQYDVTDILAQLQSTNFLTLGIPLKGKILSLNIPQSLVVEWQLLATEM